MEGLPLQYPIALKYRSSAQLSCVLGAPATWVFALNSLHDPDVTYTGHQPLLHDQLGALYWNYGVESVDVKFTVIPFGGTPVPCMSTFYVSQTNTASTYSMQEAREQKEAVIRPIAGSSNVGVLTKTIKIADWLALDRALLESSTYQTAVGSNPTDILYGILEVATLDASSLTFYCDVEITYHAAYSQPRQFASS